MAKTELHIMKSAIKSKNDRMDKRVKSCFGKPQGMADGGPIDPRWQQPVPAPVTTMPSGAQWGGSLASRGQDVLGPVADLASMRAPGPLGQTPMALTPRAPMAPPASTATLPANSAGLHMNADRAVAAAGLTNGPAPVAAPPVAPAPAAAPTAPAVASTAQILKQFPPPGSPGFDPGGPRPLAQGLGVVASRGRMGVQAPAVVQNNIPGFESSHQYADGGNITMPPGGMKKGGMIRGPGGPTEDKVPIMASPGEYILPADTVQAVGKENLDQLKAQTHTPVQARFGMAGGGSIEDYLRSKAEPVLQAARAPFRQAAAAGLPPHPEDTPEAMSRAMAEDNLYDVAATPAAPFLGAARGVAASPGMIKGAVRSVRGMFGKKAAAAEAPAAAAPAAAPAAPAAGEVIDYSKFNLPGQNANAAFKGGTTAEAAAYRAAQEAPAVAPAAAPAAPQLVAATGGRITAGSPVGAAASTQFGAPSAPNGTPTWSDARYDATHAAATATQSGAPADGRAELSQFYNDNPDVRRAVVQANRPDTDQHDLGDYGAPGTQIFGRSSTPGGKINSFTGIGGGKPTADTGVDFGIKSGEVEAYKANLGGALNPPGVYVSPEAQRMRGQIATLSDKIAGMKIGDPGLKRTMRQLAAVQGAVNEINQADTSQTLANRHAFDQNLALRMHSAGLQNQYQIASGQNELSRAQMAQQWQQHVNETGDRRRELIHQYGRERIGDNEKLLDNQATALFPSDKEKAGQVAAEAKRLALTQTFEGEDGKQHLFHDLDPTQRGKVLGQIMQTAGFNFQRLRNGRPAQFGSGDVRPATIGEAAWQATRDSSPSLLWEHVVRGTVAADDGRTVTKAPSVSSAPYYNK